MVSLARVPARPLGAPEHAGRRVQQRPVALGDETEHDDRYARTVEYTQILTALLRGETVTVDGRWHQVHNLRLAPALPPELMPEVLISGSSPAGRGRGRGDRRDARSATPSRSARTPSPTPTRPPAAASGWASSPATTPTRPGAWPTSASRPTARARSPTPWRCASPTRTGTTSSPRPGMPPRRRRPTSAPSRTPTGSARSRTTSRSAPTWSGSHDRVAAEVARYVERGTERVRARHPAGGRGPRPRGRGVRPRRGGGPRMTRHLQDLLAASADRHADRPALVGVDETLTYAELDAAVEPGRPRAARARPDARARGCACSRRRRRGRSRR